MITQQLENILLGSAYLAPINTYRLLSRSKVAHIEACDNYIKQSYRNRCVIASPQGPLTLTIPIVKPAANQHCMKDIQISEHGKWRHLHWNALVSAYNNSPYFMYYQDDLAPFYEKQYTWLYDYNMELCQLMCSLLDIPVDIEPTVEFTPIIKDVDEAWRNQDFRMSIHPKVTPDAQSPYYVHSPYYQVFEQKYGFLDNLSIVDLLFNLGPEGLLYLDK